MSTLLLQDDASDNEDLGFNINPSFASKYESMKRKQELSLLEARYNNNHYDNHDDDEDESTSEEEDEDAELLTPNVDAQILKTINAIRERKAAVYDPQVKFFKEQEQQEKQEDGIKKKKEKPLTLVDYQVKTLLETEGRDIEEEENEDVPVTHVQEQETLKNEFKAAIDSAMGEEEEEDLFAVKKVEEVPEMDDETYGSFLLQQMNAPVKDLKTWEEREKKRLQEKDPNEAFLMEYILTRGWLDKSERRTQGQRDEDDERDESAGPEEENGKQTFFDPTIDDDEDEEEVEKAEEFERKYNFRFEEEEGAHIQTYARDLDGLLRRKDTSRQEKRKALKEKKMALKKKKQEELKRLKNLKKQELAEKLKKIAEMAGGKIMGLDEVDLEKEFNPEEYDAKMDNVFNENYYQSEDPLKKPVFEDDIDISDLTGGMEEEADTVKTFSSVYQGSPEDDEKFIMDADYLPGGEYYQEESEEVVDDKKSKKKKKKGKDNVEEPSEKMDLGEYLDEYYQLDYEDLIGDIPTRFKYRQVEKLDFGLSPEEILKAEDTELNKLVSLKKIAPYRRADVVEKDLEKFKKSKKKRLREFRQVLHGKSTENSWENMKKRREEEQEQNEEQQKKRKLEKVGISEDRLASYTSSSTKSKKSKKRKI